MRSIARRLSTILGSQRGAGLQIEFSCGGGGYPFLWLGDARGAGAPAAGGQRLFETHELPESAELACELKTTSAGAIELQWDDSVAARYPASFCEFAPGSAASSQRERYGAHSVAYARRALARPHDWPAVESGGAPPSSTTCAVRRRATRFAAARARSRSSRRRRHRPRAHDQLRLRVRRQDGDLRPRQPRAVGPRAIAPHRQPRAVSRHPAAPLPSRRPSGRWRDARRRRLGDRRGVAHADPPAFAALSAPRRFRYADVGNNGGHPPISSPSARRFARSTLGRDHGSRLQQPLGAAAARRPRRQRQRGRSGVRGVARSREALRRRRRPRRRVRLAPGDALVMDNSRVMHGRAPFSGAERRLQGCYVDADGVGRSCRARARR